MKTPERDGDENSKDQERKAGTLLRGFLSQFVHSFWSPSLFWLDLSVFFFSPSWAKIPKGIFPSIKWRKGQGTNLWIRCFSNKWFKCLCRLQQLCNATCLTGLPRWFNCKEYSRWCRRHRRHGFNPWVGKIPWRREWQPSPSFLPGKSHGQRSLVGYSSWDCKKSDMT